MKNKDYLQYVELARAAWLLRTSDAKAAHDLMDQLLKEVGLSGADLGVDSS